MPIGPNAIEMKKKRRKCAARLTFNRLVIRKAEKKEGHLIEWEDVDVEKVVKKL